MTDQLTCSTGDKERCESAATEQCDSQVGLRASPLTPQGDLFAAPERVELPGVVDATAQGVDVGQEFVVASRLECNADERGNTIGGCST